MITALKKAASPIVLRFLRDFLIRYRYVIVRTPAAFLNAPQAELRPTLDLVLAHYVSTHPVGSFVQIGAFDGLMQDPIVEFVRRHHWKGLLVEPQPDVFKRLQANYKDEAQLVLVQAAVSQTDGMMPFYRIRRDVPNLPEWTQMVASFDRSLIARHRGLIPNVDALIEEISVPTMSMKTLLESTGFVDCDLLQIDAEGFDYDILKMMVSCGIRPAIVNYEHIHLPPDDHEASLELLASVGYKLAVTNTRDTLAYFNRN